MKAIHGGKTKNDKIDSQKIALLLRGGMLPMAYVYPPACGRPATCCGDACTCATRAEALAHIQNSVSQYNLPPLAKKLTMRPIVKVSPRSFAREHARRVESDLA